MICRIKIKLQRIFRQINALIRHENMLFNFNLRYRILIYTTIEYAAALWYDMLQFSLKIIQLHSISSENNVNGSRFDNKVECLVIINAKTTVETLIGSKVIFVTINVIIKPRQKIKGFGNGKNLIVHKIKESEALIGNKVSFVTITATIKPRQK